MDPSCRHEWSGNKKGIFHILTRCNSHPQEGMLQNNPVSFGCFLVGGWTTNPFENILYSQIGSFFQVVVVYPNKVDVLDILFTRGGVYP